VGRTGNDPGFLAMHRRLALSLHVSDSGNKTIRPGKKSLRRLKIREDRQETRWSFRLWQRGRNLKGDHRASPEGGRQKSTGILFRFHDESGEGDKTVGPQN